MNIMDPQISKGDAVPHPFVLSHHSHTGTVHFLTQAIALSRDHAAFIRDLQILDHNMLCIVQKHCRRYIAVIHMRRCIQRGPIILIPDPLSICCNDRKNIIFHIIGTNYNWCFLRSAVFQL